MEENLCLLLPCSPEMEDACPVLLRPRFAALVLCMRTVRVHRAQQKKKSATEQLPRDPAVGLALSWPSPPAPLPGRSPQSPFPGPCAVSPARLWVPAAQGAPGALEQLALRPSRRGLKPRGWRDYRRGAYGGAGVLSLPEQRSTGACVGHHLRGELGCSAVER